MSKHRSHMILKASFGFSIFLLLISMAASGQISQSYNYPDLLEYQKAKVEIKNWQQYKGNSLLIRPETNSVFLTQKEAGHTLDWDLKDVYEIEVEKGSMAVLYGILGGAMGLLAGGYLATTMNSEGAGFAAFFGFGAVGLTVGALIGSNSKTYRTIYSHGKFIN